MSDKSYVFCGKVSAVLLFMLIFQLVRAQRVKPGTEAKLEPYQQQIDQKLDDAKKELGGSFAALLYKDGKIIYQKFNGTDFNGKTQVPVGAVSQWLTTALVMSFVDEGKLSLDDKISKYLPVFTKYSKGYITIKDCLAHLTGIESETGRSSITAKRKFASLDEEVTDFASKKEILSNPGLEFRFSNTGLNIAGRIVEIVGKRGFEQLMSERITRPLMMRNTSFSSFSTINPSGGAQSTANDLINFLSMLLNKGMFNGKQVLSAKAVTEMLTIRTTPDMIRYTPKETQGYQFGLGAWIIESDGNSNGTVVTAPGFSGTWPMIDVCRGYALVILTKGDLNEEKIDLYMHIRSIIDDNFAPKCQ
jgi:CubicO group peptidase (beta-lactamase class C family)